MTTPENTFAHASDRYASARPSYPPALFAWIAAQCRHHDDAWDCATGNGQAAVGLARHFARVHATDVSAEQLAHGKRRDNVAYTRSPAEATPFAAASFDLVTVAQALHWFDFARFWPEVVRVARPGAVFAAWGYDWFQSAVPSIVEDAFVRPIREVLAPFWAPNNVILWRGYRDEDIACPFPRLPTPDFAIEVAWTVAQLLDYLTTWSAFKRSRADADAVRAIDAIVARTVAQIPADQPLAIRMPLKVVAASIQGTGAP